MFIGLNLFDLARFLLVFGFSLGVLQYIHKVTDFKSPRNESRNKLIGFGVIVVIIGIVVGVFSIIPTITEEIRSIRGIGTDIIALGFSCMLQVFNLKKHQKYLTCATYILIALGAAAAIIAVFANIYKWF